MSRPIRLAARALILHENRLLLVNAFPVAPPRSDDTGRDCAASAGPHPGLWCAPGGGAEPHSSLPQNLMREVYEETGLSIDVLAPALINEFHDHSRDFHQVDLYFHCNIINGLTIRNGCVNPDWRDPMGVVSERRLFSRDEIQRGSFRYTPAVLQDLVWEPSATGATLLRYSPLEPMIRAF